MDVIARETSNETGKTEEEVRRGVEFCLRASRRSRRTSRRGAIAPDATPLPRVSERDAVVSTPSPRPLDGAEILTGRYAQVRRYHTVFWQRHKELADWERVIDKIEKGEKRLQRSKEIREALAEKIARSPKPHECLPLNYGASRGKVWTEEEDAYDAVWTSINYAIEPTKSRGRRRVNVWPPEI